MTVTREKYIPIVNITPGVARQHRRCRHTCVWFQVHGQQCLAVKVPAGWRVTASVFAVNEQLGFADNPKEAIRLAALQLGRIRFFLADNYSAN